MPEATELGVSVIVPVRDRRDLLARTLDALDAQTYRHFEVIVVDDGSTDGTLELARSRQVAGRAVRCLQSPGRGAVAARQYGCAHAAAPLLAFTDSDCTPAPEWLSLMVAAADRGADLVAGPTLPQRPPRPLERTLTAGDDGGYPTCNVLYRRALFDAVGGFQSGIQARGMAGQIGMWEDTLMAWRLRRAGAATAFEPNAVVYHHVFPPDLRDVLRRNWMMGGIPNLVRRVPELRATLLHGRVFYGQRSRALIYVIAAALPARRPRVAGAALVAWCASRLQRGRAIDASFGDVVRSLPGELAKDVVFSISVVQWSARARTLVI